jgi:CPA2 family monovalent cation:H+ antiporter-2
VRKARLLDLPVFYGDATSEEALHHAGIERARMVVLLMNDPLAAERVCDTIRRVSPGTAILMRTRYLTEREPLFKLGATDVVAEEVQSAVEIIARMLRFIDVPRNVIDESIRHVRSESQTSERKQTMPRGKLGDVRALADMKIETAMVHMNSPLSGASLVSMRLRNETGALVVGVRRGETLLDNPDPTVPFEPGDVVYLAGTREALRKALHLFAPVET